MKKLVSVRLASGERRSIKLSDCNKVIIYQDSDGTRFVPIPKPIVKETDSPCEYVDARPELLDELLSKPPAINNRQPQPRNQGKTAKCLKMIEQAFSERWSDPPPTPTELARKCGCLSRNPAFAAYDLFYEGKSYRKYKNEGCVLWGPGPRSKQN